MLTTADLVAMLVLSTMLVLSRYRATVQKYPFPEKKSIVDVVLCQHRDSRVDCEEIIRLKKMKRWPALQPRRFWQQVATVVRMTSSGWRSALLLPFANNTSIE